MPHGSSELYVDPQPTRRAQRRPNTSTLVTQERKLTRARLNTTESVERRLFPEKIKRILLEKITDPESIMRITAILGATVIIKEGLDWSGDAIENAHKFLSGFPLSILGEFIPGYSKKEPLDLGSDLGKWIISFALAYLIVTHFAEIVTALSGAGGGILGLAKVLIA